MTPTREEVERLAKRFDVNAADWRWDEDHHAARDMLRALADERDAERQLRINLERQRNEANAYGDTAIAERDAALAECERLRLGGCARGQTTTQWCAEAVQMMTERDAALAEAARLREAHTELDTWARAEIARLRRLWTYMQEAASDIEADEPMTAAEWLAEFSTAEQATRAALATEARDE